MTESYPIVGAHFRPPAKAILGELPSGQALALVPEPDNPFDPNAVKVIVRLTDINDATRARIEPALPLFGFTWADLTDEIHLGYVPRGLAIELAPALAGAQAPATLTFGATGAPHATRATVQANVSTTSTTQPQP